jgi:hypothetical protein
VLKRIAKWALGTAAAAVLFAVAVNAFDEDLHPEVTAYLEARPRAVADANNGYVQAIGLASGDEAARLPPQLQANGDFCAMDTGGDCLQRVRAEKATALRLVGDHAGLLERYRALLEAPEYLETQAASPNYLPLTAGQKLFHIESTLRLEKGKALHVAYDLERSLKLSRRMLAGSTSLFGKMIAAAHARRAALFASQVLPSLARADRKALLGHLAEALAPLSSAERSLVAANRTDFLAFRSLMRMCEPGAVAGVLDAVGCYFYQPNATLNRSYFTLHKVLIAGDAAPTQDFDELRGALKSSFPWGSILYNPVGKVLLAARSGAGWSAYVARVQDVDALFRIVALQALLGERGLKGERVPEFLAENAKRYADPYSGKAMGWDAARGQLYFEPRGTPGLQSVGGVEKRFSVGL